MNVVHLHKYNTMKVHDIILETPVTVPTASVVVDPIPEAVMQQWVKDNPGKAKEILDKLDKHWSDGYLRVLKLIGILVPAKTFMERIFQLDAMALEKTPDGQMKYTVAQLNATRRDYYGIFIASQAFRGAMANLLKAPILREFLTFLFSLVRIPPAVSNLILTGGLSALSVWLGSSDAAQKWLTSGVLGMVVRGTGWAASEAWDWLYKHAWDDVLVPLGLEKPKDRGVAQRNSNADKMSDADMKSAQQRRAEADAKFWKGYHDANPHIKDPSLTDPNLSLDQRVAKLRAADGTSQ